MATEKKNVLDADHCYLWFFVAVLVGIIVSALPTPEGLTPEGQTYLAILSAMLIMFLTEPLPLPMVMVMGASALMVSQVGSTSDVWLPFAHPVVFFVLGCLMIAAVAESVGLTRRLAQILLRYCGTNVVRFSFLSCILLGAAASIMHDVSAVTLGLMTILPLMREIDIRPGSRTGIFLIISLTFACSAGGMGTLVGGGRNMVAAAFLHDLTGLTISFEQWMLRAFPLIFLAIPAVWAAVYLVFRPDRSLHFRNPNPGHQAEREPLSGNEVKALVLIVITFIGFFTSGLHDLDYSIIVMISAALLLLMRVVDWEYINSRTEWAVSFLVFGGGISLGQAMDYTGAGKYLAHVFFPLFEGRGWFLLFVGIGIFASLMTELMANVAAASLIMPIAIPMAQMEGIDPTVVALALGMFTSFSYLIVVGCPPNVVAYSFGYFRASDLFKAGVIAQPLGMLATALAALVWWSIIGFAG